MQSRSLGVFGQFPSSIMALSLFPSQSSKWRSSPRTEISDQCQGVIVETFTFSPFSLLQTLGQSLYGNLLHILRGGFHEESTKVAKHLTHLNPLSFKPCSWPMPLETITPRVKRACRMQNGATNRAEEFNLVYRA